jgi:hypothetical protein
MADFTRAGHVFRIDDVNSHMRRIVVQFAEPLPFKPGEQSESSDARQIHEAAAV